MAAGIGTGPIGPHCAWLQLQAATESASAERAGGVPILPPCALTASVRSSASTSMAIAGYFSGSHMRCSWRRWRFPQACQLTAQQRRGAYLPELDGAVGAARDEAAAARVYRHCDRPGRVALQVRQQRAVLRVEPVPVGQPKSLRLTRRLADMGQSPQTSTAPRRRCGSQRRGRLRQGGTYRAT